MTDISRCYLRHFILLLLMLCARNVSALNISSFAREADGEATVSFCGAIAVQNIALEKVKGFGPVLVLPKDLGGYKNLKITSPALEGEVKKCFDSCPAARACKGQVNIKVKSARLFKSKKGVVATLAFDDALNAVFLVSKYQKNGKDIFRIKYPQDLSIAAPALKERVKKLLTQEAKKLL